MIKIDNVEVLGWEHAIRGIRNIMNDCDKSDSGICKGGDDGIGCKNCAKQIPCEHTYNYSFQLGKNDYELMMKLSAGKSVHTKYREMITVYLDITAPLYWWEEFDTYNVTIIEHCSTRHMITEKEFTIDDFSTENMTTCLYNGKSPITALHYSIDCLNGARKQYLATKDQEYWWDMTQLLPSSYNQKRAVKLNYEELANIYQSHKDDKLIASSKIKYDEWFAFCQWIKILPYSEIIVGETVKFYADNKEVN